MEEIDERLALKVGKIISHVGPEALEKLGKTRRAFREEIYHSLKSGRTYVLDASKKFTPTPKVPKVTSLAEEYGLA